MMHPNSAIAQLVFMKLCAMTTVVIPDCKSMRKIVFIAKLVISKIQLKILCGSAQKVAAGQIIQICEAVLKKNKTDHIGLIGHKLPWSVLLLLALFLMPSACQTQKVTTDHVIAPNIATPVSMQAGHFLAARQAAYLNDVTASALSLIHISEPTRPY